MIDFFLLPLILLLGFLFFIVIAKTVAHRSSDDTTPSQYECKPETPQFTNEEIESYGIDIRRPQDRQKLLEARTRKEEKAREQIKKNIGLSRRANKTIAKAEKIIRKK